MLDYGLPPLDLQTEHLDRSQYPSGRLLLLIAAIMGSVLLMTWATEVRRPVPGQPIAVVEKHSIDRELAARMIPQRP
jgi:hypothetical protein